KNKKEVSALVLGLLTALAVLILINGLLGAFKERQKGMALASGAKAEEDDKTKAKPLAPTSGAAPAQDGAASSEP
ncbi:MAG TPA: hypothetical protein PKC28_11525, partial [Bdellovibrionales bacterium]|nr:hypothetical protein [Bdellovibrionales bacterium]